jgi:pimeloyl-ACP methyl ester carboxylesterase
MLESLLGFFGFGPDPKTSVACVRKSSADSKAAIVFVHGFTGSGATTWMGLLPRIEAQANLKSWDIYTVTYATSLSLDISELWAADANLKTLSQRLTTDLAQTDLAPYDALVLIAHSMGGLVVQKALVDSPSLVRRTRCVILLGTPSNGLKKSSGPASLLKRQLRDMAWGGSFITALRADWKAKFGDRPPFSFLAVAGERDQFVPPDSSLTPFPQEQQAVVPGNHVSMLSPAENDDNLVRLISRRICDEQAGDIGDSALRMIERGEFQRLIDAVYDKAAGLDEKALVQLAIALDAVGRRDDAYRLLSERFARRGDALGALADSLKGAWLHAFGRREDADRLWSARFARESDALGALAGRLKREWMQNRQKADGDAAFEHYEKGFELAKAGNDLSQAYYHGINLAFLEFVFKGDRAAAQKRARQALRDCEEAERSGQADEWLEATRGEAELILNDGDAALAAYRKFVDSVSVPWKLTSSYLNARTITANHPNRELVRRLGQIFGDPNP